MNRHRQHRSRETSHRRGDVLRAVLAHADSRRDGTLPLDLPGVRRAFADPADLVGALQLRWHARLGGCIERELLDRPGEPEAAVVDGWRAAASDLAGVRLILDAQAAQPADAGVAAVLERSSRKDHQLLAGMAGLAGRHGSGPADARALGRRLEERARAAAGQVVAR
ncbi:hypothetical protein [Nocardioides mesophilus]|uniref:Uncharacterized protein n=1 Tax=Nocardioides mesophilus TaxID=433659 RepID=A0A7G9RD48_9ACTN|nr:hypothetical protein [Nocardioides mesophilus]QNN53523.1 hypothetical protein H9L09_03545 [Nocardioides mesophilus]